jgi:hypothetical protein
LSAANVASVTDNGVGDWTFNLTTALASANFHANAIAEHATVKCFVQIHSRTTSTVRVLCFDHAGTAADPSFVDLEVWGTL